MIKENVQIVRILMSLVQVACPDSVLQTFAKNVNGQQLFKTAHASGKDVTSGAIIH